MYATVLFAALATTALAVPVVQRSQPTGWATDFLEKYATYHTRYVALSCQTQHNTTFFDTCCHPMLSTETLSDRPDECTPSVTESSSASAYAATASTTDSADADAATEYATATASIESVYSSIAAEASSTTYSAAASSTTSYAAATSSVADAENNWAHAHHSSSSSPTSTSTWVAATSTSSKHTKTSTAAAKTSTAASSSSSSSDVMTGGYATFFYQGGNAGECGTVHSDSDKVIAIDAAGWWSDYQSNDDSPYCGKYITITNTNNGKTVTAMVADVCPTCDTNNSLDLSVGAFTAIASESDGEVPITWVWA